MEVTFVVFPGDFLRALESSSRLCFYASPAAERERGRREKRQLFEKAIERPGPDVALLAAPGPKNEENLGVSRGIKTGEREEEEKGKGFENGLKEITDLFLGHFLDTDILFGREGSKSRSPSVCTEPASL